MQKVSKNTKKPYFDADKSLLRSKVVIENALLLFQKVLLLKPWFARDFLQPLTNKVSGSSKGTKIDRSYILLGLRSV